MVQSPELRPLWQGVYMRRFGTQPRVPRALSLGVGVAATAHRARFPLLLPQTPQAQTQQQPQAEKQPQRLQFQDNTAVAVVSATPTTERGEGEYCWRSLCMERHAEQTDWLWRTRGWEAVKDAGHVRETLWVGPTHEFSSLLEAVHASAAFDRIIVDAPASYAFAPEIVLLPHSIEICGLQRRAASSTDMALSSGCASDSAGEGRGRDDNDNDNDGERNRDGNGNGATATGAREGIVVEAGAVEFVYRSPPTPPTQPTQRHEPFSRRANGKSGRRRGRLWLMRGALPRPTRPPFNSTRFFCCAARARASDCKTSGCGPAAVAAMAGKAAVVAEKTGKVERMGRFSAAAAAAARRRRPQQRRWRVCRSASARRCRSTTAFWSGSRCRWRHTARPGTRWDRTCATAPPSSRAICPCPCSPEEAEEEEEEEEEEEAAEAKATGEGTRRRSSYEGKRVVVAASIVTAARRWLGRTRWTDVYGRAPCRRTRRRRTAGGGTGEAFRHRPGAKTRATRSSTFGGEGVGGRAQGGRGRLFNVGSIVAGPCSPFTRLQNRMGRPHSSSFQRWIIMRL